MGLVVSKSGQVTLGIATERAESTLAPDEITFWLAAADGVRVAATTRRPLQPRSARAIALSLATAAAAALAVDPSARPVVACSVGVLAAAVTFAGLLRTGGTRS